MRVEISGKYKVPSKKNSMELGKSHKTGKSVTFKKQSIKDFERYLSYISRAKMNSLGLKAFTKPVRFSIVVVVGDKIRRDLPNMYGSTCDALNGIVYNDDSQIVELSGQKIYKKGRWGFTITVEEVEDSGYFGF